MLKQAIVHTDMRWEGAGECDKIETLTLGGIGRFLWTEWRLGVDAWVSVCVSVHVC